MNRLPSESDFIVHGDLDERDACAHFLGKTLEEAEALFRESSVGAAQDSMWMGPVAFEYYLPAALAYLRSPESAEDSDILNALYGTLAFRIENDQATKLN